MQGRPPELAAGLEQRKQVLRSRYSVDALSAEAAERQEDARWASQDPEVLVLYDGKFVVPYQRRIVASGSEAAAVLAEAARITGVPADRLPIVGLINPLLDIPR